MSWALWRLWVLCLKSIIEINCMTGKPDDTLWVVYNHPGERSYEQYHGHSGPGRVWLGQTVELCT